MSNQVCEAEKKISCMYRNSSVEIKKNKPVFLPTTSPDSSATPRVRTLHAALGLLIHCLAVSRAAGFLEDRPFFRLEKKM
jgi:hypothetical protein